jgi:UDP-glucose 4-epimerase
MKANQPNGLHVLVTGGAGFIGSNLVEFHLGKGDKVHVVDDLSTGSLGNIEAFQSHPRFRFTQADILVWDDLYKSVAWADRIYHMAAVVGVHKVLAEPIHCLATNIAGCERVLRAASANGWKPQIVLPSTAEVYGEATAGGGAQLSLAADFSGYREDAELVVGSTAIKRWNYPISKITNEALGLSYGQAFGMEVLIARLFNSIGPRQTGRYGMVLPRFVKQAVAGEPITVYGDGLQTRSFCDVRDTVALLDALASHPGSAGEIINVGNNREISIRALAELVKGLAHSASPIVFVPYNVAYGEGNVETYRRKPDLTKLFAHTTYRHQWTLEASVRDLIEREHTKADDAQLADWQPDDVRAFQECMVT